MDDSTTHESRRRCRTSTSPSPWKFSEDGVDGGRPASTSLGRHPVYRGVRCRGIKWVSEIREPRKAKRIWLGTYSVAEMAAVAYDVACLSLKGSEAVLNFPHAVPYHPTPASLSPSDIQSAAAKAAAAFSLSVPPAISTTTSTAASSAATERNDSSDQRQQFMDEEEVLNMPNLLQDMAEAMMMSPPRLGLESAELEDYSPEAAAGHAGSLWSYDG